MARAIRICSPCLLWLSAACWAGTAALAQESGSLNPRSPDAVLTVVSVVEAITRQAADNAVKAQTGQTCDSVVATDDGAIAKDKEEARADAAQRTSAGPAITFVQIPANATTQKTEAASADLGDKSGRNGERAKPVSQEAPQIAPTPRATVAEARPVPYAGAQTVEQIHIPLLQSGQTVITYGQHVLKDDAPAPAADGEVGEAKLPSDNGFLSSLAVPFLICAFVTFVVSVSRQKKKKKDEHFTAYNY
jgi:hypothetical protein